MDNIKKCTKCQEEKSLNDFNKDRTKKDGLRPICKSCTSKQQKQYAQKNKVKIAEYQKEYAKEKSASITRKQKKALFKK